jgi:hypothetical protein
MAELKTNQYEIFIPCNRVQEAYERPGDLELNMKNSNFLDNFQVVTSEICRKYAGKNIIITVQIKKGV